MQEPQAGEPAPSPPTAQVFRPVLLAGLAVVSVICAALSYQPSDPSEVPFWVILVSVAAILGGAVAFPNPFSAAAPHVDLSYFREHRVLLGAVVLGAPAVAACIIWSMEPFSQVQEFVNSASTYAAFLWIAGMAAGLAVLWPTRGNSQAEPPPLSGVGSRWIVAELFALLLILDLAAGIRLWHLASVPEGIWFDEADFANAAQRLYNLPFQPFGPGDVGHIPSLYFYLEAGLLKLVGASMAGTRLASVLFGVVTVFAVYWFGRKVGGPALGLCAGSFLAMAQWAVDFSRLGMATIAPGAFIGLGFVALAFAMRRPRGFWFALSGLLLGLAVLTYAGGLVTGFGVALCVIVVRSIGDSSYRVRSWPQVLLLPIGIAVGAAPYVAPLLQDSSFVLDRVRTVSLFTEYADWPHRWSAIGGNLRAHLLMFTVAGDMNGRHNLPGAPMLDRVTAACFLLGLGMAGRRIRHWFYQVLLLWLIANLLGGILSLDFEAPQGDRTSGATAPIVLIAALPLAALARLLFEAVAARFESWRTRKSDVAGRNPGAPWLAQIAAVAISACVVSAPLGVALSTNLNDYFVRHAHDLSSWSEMGGLQAITGRAAVQLMREGYSVRVSPLLAGDIALEWAANNIPLSPYDPAVPVSLPIPPRGLALIIPATEPNVISFVRQSYPDARMIPLTPSFDHQDVQAEVITVSPTDAERNTGLTATFGSGFSETVIEHVVGEQSWPPGSGRDTPVVVRGVLKIGGASAWSPVSFRLVGLAHASISIDDATWRDAATGTGPLRLAAGNHALVINGAGKAAPSIALEWTGGSGTASNTSWSLIPASNLGSPQLPTGGLLGLYFSGSAIAGSPVLEQVDQTINSYYQQPPFGLQFPFSARWLGALQAPIRGNYGFALDSTGPSTLYIDGKILIQEQPGAGSSVVTVPLTAGSHRIRVDYSATGSYLHCYLTWLPPGQTAFTAIPTAVLEPAHE